MIENRTIQTAGRLQELVNQRQQQLSNVKDIMSADLSLKGNITYINDASSVSVFNTAQTLNTLTSPVIWIAGGASWDLDYSSLKSIVEQKVRVLICLDQEVDNLFRTFGNLNLVFITAGSIEEAVTYARLSAMDNDVVLFSPCCPSYGIYNGLEKRHHDFNVAVAKL